MRPPQIKTMHYSGILMSEVIIETGILAGIDDRDTGHNLDGQHSGVLDPVRNVANQTTSRRGFLRQSVQAAALAGSGVLAAGLSGNVLASAITAPIHGPDRHLRLVNAHTWEKLDVMYWSQGEYVKEGLREISFLMRDHRANESIGMDPRLIDDLHSLYNLLGTEERIHVLSGYRTQATNAKLRKRSNGVAKYSLHMEGRAVDISVPGTHAKDIREAALSMKAGGVGYYASSGFVHIDTGNIRSWSRS